MTPIHNNLSNGYWQELSLAEQMGNIGSEIHRSLKWQDKNVDSFNKAIDRALELLDLTINDIRWQKGRRELTRVREILCDAFLGQEEFNTSLKDLDDYFMAFAMKARN